MNEITVGFGTHEHSTSALEWASRLAQRAHAHITVLSVFHPTYVELSPDGHRRYLADRQRQVETIVTGAGHDDFDVVTLEGDATAELLRFSHDLGADLIVVGHHESMAPGGFGERGAADQLLRSSTIPFVVVGDQAPLPELDKPFPVVVGIDGSDANADAAKAIGVLTEAVGATVIPVFAVNTGASTTRDHYGSRLLHEDEARAVAATFSSAEPLRTVNEMPVQGLVDVARTEAAGLIAIGTRGHWGVVDLLAGQIARHVIDRAPCAVLVSPHH